MTAKATCIWVAIAAVLAAFIFLLQPHLPKGPPAPARVLANFNPAKITAIQIHRLGTPETVALRTNSAWQVKISETQFYPANPASIEKLLVALEHLSPAAYLSAGELRRRPQADAEYGFAAPQASLILWQGEQLLHLLVGTNTPPGDQLYFQVIGKDGAYVVDADLLSVIPASVNEWRDATVINIDGLAFDRLAVTNNTKIFVLQRDLAEQRWRMVWPFTKGARADNARIESCLVKLQSLKVRQFISDDPKADLDRYGLAPAELDLALADGTNTLALLQLGKSPTNAPTEVYARRFGQNTIFTVPKELQEPWRAASVNDFRDPHLLTVNDPVESFEVHARDAFSVVRQTNSAWRVLPENFPADKPMVDDFLSRLTRLQIADFVKDVVNPSDLPKYGLANPLCQYVLRTACTNTAALDTNKSVVDLTFGISTNAPNLVYARRADENPVYAITAAEFAALPLASLDFRDRQLWDIPDEDITAVTILHRGKMRRILRKGQHAWSLAPGSQGILEELPVDATVHSLAHLVASRWVGRGDQELPNFGFIEGGFQIVLELNNGGRAALQFGAESPSGTRFAAANLQGQTWIMEFPWLLYRDVSLYLSIPP